MSNDYYLDPRVAAAYDAEHRGSGAVQDIIVDDIPFYVALARAADARGERVLELGCGTGRVTIPMAQAGFEVVGIDNAAPMLHVARRKAEALGLRNLTWLQADMASFVLDARFGLAVIPFRSFQMLLTEERQRACLACIHEHLIAGGSLVLNVANPEPLLAARHIEARNKAPHPLHAGPGRSDWKSEVSKTPRSDLPGGRGFVARVQRNLRLRYVFRDELELLLTSAGFAIEALYGWFDGRPFAADSDEIVLIASRT